MGCVCCAISVWNIKDFNALIFDDVMMMHTRDHDEMMMSINMRFLTGHDEIWTAGNFF